MKLQATMLASSVDLVTGTVGPEAGAGEQEQQDIQGLSEVWEAEASGLGIWEAEASVLGPLEAEASVLGPWEAEASGLGPWEVGLVVVLGLVFVVASVLNTLFLVIFVRRASLRNVSNRFLVSLSCSNLVGSWLLLPLVVVDVLLWRRCYSAGWCRVLDGLAMLTLTVSVASVALIAVDRHAAITDALRYQSKATPSRSAGLLLGVWFFALTITVVSAITDQLPHTAWNVCQMSPGWSSSPTSVYPAVSLLLTFLLPFLALCCLYAQIYRAAHLNSERTRRGSLLGAATGNGASTPHTQRAAGVTSHIPSSPPLPELMLGRSSPSRTPSMRSSSSQLVHQLRHRLSNASLFLYREEARTARVSVVVVFLYTVAFLPYTLSALLPHALIQVCVPPLVQRLCVVLLVCNAAVSPYVYIYRSKRIVREVRRLLGCPAVAESSFTRYNQRRCPLNYLHNIPAGTILPVGVLQNTEVFNSTTNIKPAFNNRRTNVVKFVHKLLCEPQCEGSDWRASTMSTASTTSSNTTNCSNDSCENDSMLSTNQTS